MLLQVWFQNARAKWRRMMLKQEGKSGEKCSGSEGLSDMDLYTGSGSMGGSIQSLNPHSPPFMLPSSSPSSSLDCSWFAVVLQIPSRHLHWKWSGEVPAPRESFLVYLYLLIECRQRSYLRFLSWKLQSSNVITV